MKKMIMFFHFSDTFVKETKQYRKIDLLLSVITYLLVFFLYYFMGKIFGAVHSLSERTIFTLTGISSLIIFLIIRLITLIRKQRLFNHRYARQSLRTGLILALIVTVFFISLAILSGMTLKSDVLLIIIRFFYYLLEIAFIEELLFRNYIGPRFYGCMKNKTLAIGITALLFVFFHFPFHMAYENMTMWEYFSSTWPNLLFIFFLHFVFQFLYAKYNNIIAPTLFHFAWDYVQWLI